MEDNIMEALTGKNQEGIRHAIGSTLAEDASAKTLARVLSTGLSDMLLTIANVEGGRAVTVSFLEPGNIVHECINNRVLVEDEYGVVWFEGVISLRAAKILAEYLDVSDAALEMATGPIIVAARMSDCTRLEAANAAMDRLHRRA